MSSVSLLVVIGVSEQYSLILETLRPEYGKTNTARKYSWGVS